MSPKTQRQNNKKRTHTQKVELSTPEEDEDVDFIGDEEDKQDQVTPKQGQFSFNKKQKSLSKQIEDEIEKRQSEPKTNKRRRLDDQNSKQRDDIKCIITSETVKKDTITLFGSTSSASLAKDEDILFPKQNEQASFSYEEKIQKMLNDEKNSKRTSSKRSISNNSSQERQSNSTSTFNNIIMANDGDSNFSFNG